MENVKQIQWHNKRYTSEDIAIIQDALNKQALGHLIEVTGNMDQNTLNAIRAFLTLYSTGENPLKVDGLAGDKTLSALGIDNISGNNLGQTRAGAYQGRKNTAATVVGKANKDIAIMPQDLNLVLLSGNENERTLKNVVNVIKQLGYVPEQYSGMLGAIAKYIPNIYDYLISGSAGEQGALGSISLIGALKKKQDAERIAYYNSPEMIQYLTHAPNAVGLNKDQYNTLVKEALPYLSSAHLGRVRSVNNIGDEYDEDIMNLHNDAVKRDWGIREAKNATANGQTRTEKQIDRYASTHRFSPQLMLEVMADPAYVQAGLGDATRLDNGRVARYENVYGVLNHVTNEMNDVGVNYALPGMMAIPSLATAPVAMVGSALGGAGVNYGVRRASGGQYGSWGQFVADKTGTLDKQWAWEFTNPGAIIGGLAGGAVEGYTPGRKAIRMKTANPRAGETYVTKSGKVPVLTGTLVIEVSSGGANSAVVPGKVMGGFGHATSPIFEMREIPGMVKHRPAYVYKTIAPATKSKFNPTFYDQWQSYSNSNTQAPMNLNVPTYDQGVTYAPYQGFNRVLFKTGGKLNYLQYIK